MTRILIAMITMVASVFSAGSAQAALLNRGGGMLYDDVLNVTWLQDANYAKTSGYDADGRMNWADANTWAATLAYGGYDDWRLARNSPVAGNWNYNLSKNGSTDKGYNILSAHSELAYMYYVNLSLKGYFSSTGAYQPNWGIFGNGTTNGSNNIAPAGQNDVGLIKNLQAGVYWSGTSSLLNGNDAWTFNTEIGYQDVSLKSSSFGLDDGNCAGGDGYDGCGLNGVPNPIFAWAVRDGDVAVTTNDVPEPHTNTMLLTGLGILVAIHRRRRLLGDSEA